MSDGQSLGTDQIPRDLLVEEVVERDGDHLWYWCDGCEQPHNVRIDPEGWVWNGSLTKPTFSPSVLVRWEHGPARQPRRCHSYVREGMIEFLTDSTHKLAGKIVPVRKWIRAQPQD